jgi:Holliday junction resolvase RusA-like endonuclease
VKPARDRTIILTIPGPPRGKQRPRFVRATGRTYTPAETEQAEADVLTVWLADGQPRIDGPVALRVEAVMRRPDAHWCVDGTLSAAGRRTPRPTRKPDVDNILKLIADALSGRAFGDDALIVEARCAKWWAGRHESEHVIVDIVPAGTTP